LSSSRRCSAASGVGRHGAARARRKSSSARRSRLPPLVHRGASHRRHDRSGRRRGRPRSRPRSAAAAGRTRLKRDAKILHMGKVGPQRAVPLRFPARKYKQCTDGDRVSEGKKRSPPTGARMDWPGPVMTSDEHLRSWRRAMRGKSRLPCRSKTRALKMPLRGAAEDFLWTGALARSSVWEPICADPTRIRFTSTRTTSSAFRPSATSTTANHRWHAYLLTCAAPREGEHVVHNWSGRWYYTAIMAHLVAPSGSVTAIELNLNSRRVPWTTFLRIRMLL